MTGRCVSVATIVVALSACASGVGQSGQPLVVSSTSAPPSPSALAAAPPSPEQIPSPAPRPGDLTMPSAPTTAAAGTSASSAGPTTAAQVAIDDAALAAAAQRLLEGGATAVSISVWRNGHGIDRVYGAAPAPDARFRIASISKTVVALGTVRLARAGLLVLDEPLVPKLEEMGFTVHRRFASVTLRSLLTHTAGFGSMVDYPLASCRAYVERLLRAGPTSVVGRYAYSNHDYCLVGLILEHLAGRPYDALLQELVWAPAGVTGAHVAPDSWTFLDGDVQVDTTRDRGDYLSDLGASAAMVASPQELVRIALSISAEESAAMRAVTSGSYGLGTMVKPDRWGHTGSIFGGAACLWVHDDGTVWAAAAATPGTSVSGADLYDLFIPGVRRAATSLRRQTD